MRLLLNYIAFRDSLGSNIAKVRIQCLQIKINITEPIDPKNRIGEVNNDSYNWNKNYKVYCKKFDDIGKVCNVILIAINKWCNDEQWNFKC